MLLLIAGFGVWSAFAFHADLGRLSLLPIERAWDAVALAGCLSLGNYALRLGRWRLYLQRLGFPLAWGRAALIYLSGFAFTLSPGKLGEMVRARYCSPLGIPPSAVAATFFVERVVDAFAMLALACFALVALGSRQSVLWMAVATAGVAVAALWLLSHPKTLERLRPAAARRGRLAALIGSLLHSLAGARALLRPPLFVLGLLIALAAWGAEGVGLAALTALAPPQRVVATLAIGIYAVAVLVGAASFLPGGLGTTEAAMSGLLVAQGYAWPEAALVTIVCRVLTLWLAVGLGWMAVLLLGRRPAIGALSCP
jgi:uncharacterized protein (TIRG00374 family)